jgi:hypothetical protein
VRQDILAERYGPLRERLDLALKQPSIVIAVKLAQRCFVELVEDIAQLVFVGASGCETGAVKFSQCPHQGIAVFAADFTILDDPVPALSWLFFLLSDVGKLLRLQTNRISQVKAKAGQSH